MNEPNRSLKRDNKPIIDLVTPSNKPHVVGMKVVCICSDMKEREVIMDAKLARGVMGFIAHRQGGTLQLSEGIPIRIPIKMEPPPVSEEKGEDVIGVPICVRCNHQTNDCCCPPCSHIMEGVPCGRKPYQHEGTKLHSYEHE